MANFTEKAILETFSSMLEELPVDKIKVSSLVKQCGISHNTFYYHFHDIYDLLDAYLNQHITFLSDFDSVDAWEQKAVSLLQKCSDHSQRVYHIFNTSARSHAEQFIYEHSYDAIVHYTNLLTNGAELSAVQISGAANFLRGAFFGFFLEYLWKDMPANAHTCIPELRKICNAFAEGLANEN